MLFIKKALILFERERKVFAVSLKPSKLFSNAWRERKNRGPKKRE